MAPTDEKTLVPEFAEKMQRIWEEEMKSY